MSGLTTFLQTELLTLSSEARRKHPEIKEAAERLGVILRSFKERPGYSIANELSKTDDALRPFVLACETKQIKLVTIAIGCIQKLIFFYAIPETSIRTILRTLVDISSHGVEIQLKILQTVLPLLNNYNGVHDDILAEAFLICFRLHESKVAVVNNTAAATLRQLVILVFDKVAKEESQNLEANTKQEVEISANEKMKLLPCAKDAYYLFQDLCLLTSGDQPRFLRLNYLSKTFGLELIESILANHYKLLREHKELNGILKELVCPMFVKNFSEKNEFSQTMRLARVVSILIKQFNEILVVECEMFLSILVKILEPEHPQWLRILVMEIFKGVCNDSNLTKSIYKCYDKKDGSSNIFRDMITVFGRLATEKPQIIGATQGGRENNDHGAGINNSHSLYAGQSGSSTSEGLSTLGSTIRIQCIDQLDKLDPPSIPDTYIFYLALVCLNSIADGLAGLTLPKFSAINHSPKAKFENEFEKEDDRADIELVTDMANIAWPGLLAAMSFYLTANLDEELFQSTMRSYQNFTNVCGVLDLVTPRDAFLTNLCKNSIPIIPILSSGLIASSANKSNHSVNSPGIRPSSPSINTSAVSFTDLPIQQQQALVNIVLNEKNLYSLRVLLNITMFLSGMLGSSWYLVLETIQLADFLLFNRPITKGSSIGNTNLSASASTNTLRRTITGSSTSLATLSQLNQPSSYNNQLMDADHLTIIGASFHRLFENSKYLDDDSFIAFASALCRLSSEVSGTPLDESISSSSCKSSRTKIFNNRSFAIDKLEYITTLDMARLMNVENQSSSKVWNLIMTHFIATANYPHAPTSIRTQCCDTIANIITVGMNYVLTEYGDVNETTQTRMLFALKQCINYNPPANEERLIQEALLYNPKTFSEVQKMGLETLNHLLQTSGHSFTCGWNLIFDMLRHIAVCAIIPSSDTSINISDQENEKHSTPTSIIPEIRAERSSMDTTASSIMAGNTMIGSKSASGLIKVAFSNLQLICTDFLSLLSPDCMHQCIATLGSFGMQSDDLNISLTAVGLLWNLSDFIQTRRMDLLKNTTIVEKIDKEKLSIDSKIENEDQNDPNTYSILWMLLLLQLSHICIDWRPEVRNSANQTLFRTITMNGNVLGPHLWNACIWEVLFPLLDSIKMSSISASKSSISKSSSPITNNERDTSGFMLHHSRDTADKQWDETKVILLTGISGIFQDFLANLYELEHFQRGFTLLLAHLEDSCLRSSQEVSLASIKSLKTIVTVSADFEDPSKLMELWRKAWETWKIIGDGINHSFENSKKLTRKFDNETELQPLTLSLSSSNASPISEDFTQDTLTAYVHMFIDLYKLIAPTFTLEDVSSLLSILRNVLVYSTSPQYRPDVDHLSPLQEAVLESVQALDMNMHGVPPLVLTDLAEYMTLAFLSPPEDSQVKSKGYIPPSQRKFSTVTYIALNKKCSFLVGDLFKTHADDISLYTDGVFERIIGAYGLPMKLKYDCPLSYKHSDDRTPLWKLATNGLLDILKVGLEKIEGFDSDVPSERFCGVWRTLVDILEGSLLSPSSPPESMKIEDLDIDEHFDISFLNIIQGDIMIFMGQPRVPEELIKKLVDVIRESSRLYYIEDTVKSDESQSRLLANDRSSDIVGTTGTIVPVMKESFAYASFMTLFNLCSAQYKDNPDVRKRIAKVVIPVLLERCETILRNYTADEPLLGRCPFPRYLMGVRKEEMLFLLKQSIQLKLLDHIMTLDENDNDVKRLLLSGPRAHLFYLYPSLCSMIACEDEVVVGLIRECLQIIGIEMGLTTLS